MPTLKLILKIAVLGSALGLCIYSISLLQGDYGPKTMEALGFRPHSDNFVSWCQNRVQHLSFSEVPSVKVVEESRQWNLVDESSGEKEVLHYLTMERWLGEFCQVKAEFSDPAKAMSLSLEPLLEIAFIDDSTKTIFRVGEDQLQLSGQIFRSETLEHGLNELREIMGIRDSKTEGL